MKTIATPHHRSESIDQEHGLRPSPVSAVDQLDDFLKDPISYGHFDWDDPITLEEFQTSQCHRGRFVAPLAF